MGRQRREGPPPWIIAGMSRACWYRAGKPDKKPLPPLCLWAEYPLQVLPGGLGQQWCRVGRLATFSIMLGVATNDSGHALVAKADITADLPVALAFVP